VPNTTLSEEISQLVHKIKRAFTGNKKQFQPFINYIRFPLYKRIRPNEAITFDFPITVLVGKNGCNKSSIIHAIYGTPGDNSTGTYWFSTTVDPIKGAANCYIYGYTIPEINKDVEVIKTRIKRQNNPDYWEPSRPLAKYGMKRMGKFKEGNPESKFRSITRWNTIQKNVEYIDFRSALSAYDKCFYFSDFNTGSKTKTAQDFIRSRSKHLQSVISSGRQVLNFHRKNRVRSNKELTDKELEIISEILDYNYTKGIIIEHSLYSAKSDADHTGTSIILSKSDDKYSEAFAGSGEFAIANTVHKIHNAPNKSLILLDEPEVSLHPKAQLKLLKYLLQEIKNKKHQIVITTHSPFFFSSLPPEAIKTLEYHETNNDITITNTSYYDEAAMAIGFSRSDKQEIYVEDNFAKIYLEKAIKENTPALIESITIKFIPGGAETLISKYFPSFSSMDNKPIVILDGDKKLASPVAPDTIPPAEYENLDDKIKELTGCDVKFFTNSGPNKEQEKIDLQLKFLEFYNEQVFFLPCVTPEEFAWTKEHPEDTENKAEYYKRKIADLSQDMFETSTAESITYAFRNLINDADFCTEEISDLVGKIAEKL